MVRLTAAQIEIEVKNASGTAAGGGAIARCLQRAFFRTPYGAVLEFNFYLRSNSTVPSKDSWLPEGQPNASFRIPQAIKKVALATA
jgi:hypothetical protein